MSIHGDKTGMARCPFISENNQSNFSPASQVPNCQNVKKWFGLQVETVAPIKAYEVCGEAVNKRSPTSARHAKVRCKDQVHSPFAQSCSQLFVAPTSSSPLLSSPLGAGVFGNLHPVNIFHLCAVAEMTSSPSSRTCDSCS